MLDIYPLGGQRSSSFVPIGQFDEEFYYLFNGIPIIPHRNRTLIALRASLIIYQKKPKILAVSREIAKNENPHASWIYHIQNCVAWSNSEVLLFTRFCSVRLRYILENNAKKHEKIRKNCSFVFLNKRISDNRIIYVFTKQIWENLKKQIFFITIFVWKDFPQQQSFLRPSIWMDGLIERLHLLRPRAHPCQKSTESIELRTSFHRMVWGLALKSYA